MIPRPPQPGHDAPALRRVLGPPDGWAERVRGSFEAVLAALRAGVPLSGDEQRFAAAYVAFPAAVVKANETGEPEPLMREVSEQVRAAHAALAEYFRPELARAVAAVVRPLRAWAARGWPAPASAVPTAALVELLGDDRVREALAAPSFGPERTKAALAAIAATFPARPAADPRLDAVFGLAVAPPFDPSAWCARWWAPAGPPGQELPRWRATP